MTPTSDASASLRLALQKLDRARNLIGRGLIIHGLAELDYTEIDIRDAQSVLTPGDTPEAGPS